MIVNNGTANIFSGRYTKFADGSVIQYGRADFPVVTAAGVQRVSVTVPVKFIETNYIVLAGWIDTESIGTAVDFIWCETANKTLNSFKLLTKRTNLTSSWYAWYLAIGLWK